MSARPSRFSALPKTFTDGTRPCVGRRTRASVNGALAINQPVVIKPPGTVVEKHLPVESALMGHKQDLARVEFIIARHHQCSGWGSRKFNFPCSEQSGRENSSHQCYNQHQARADGRALF
jgi:hypothetical protein